jgi:hypothetical protein
MKGVRECAFREPSRVHALKRDILPRTDAMYKRANNRDDKSQECPPLFGSVPTVPAHGTHSLLVQKLPFGPTHSLNCLHSFETHLRRLKCICGSPRLLLLCCSSHRWRLWRIWTPLARVVDASLARDDANDRKPRRPDPFARFGRILRRVCADASGQTSEDDNVGRVGRRGIG